MHITITHATKNTTRFPEIARTAKMKADRLHVFVGGIAPPTPPATASDPGTGAGGERGSDALASAAPGMLGD